MDAETEDGDVVVYRREHVDLVITVVSKSRSRLIKTMREER